jgi:CheY-like chemotaxis protein
MTISHIRPRALIVDDDKFSRAVAAKRMIALGADIVEAADGIVALNLLVEGDFDLVLVDLDMPGVDGYSLISCMRGHPRLRHLPAIVVTGKEERAALERALTAGATSFILKPLNWSAFGSHIGHLLHLASHRPDRARAAAASTEPCRMQA